MHPVFLTKALFLTGDQRLSRVAIKPVLKRACADILLEIWLFPQDQYNH